MAITTSTDSKAAGTVYGIDLYGYIPFICYLRDDAVSIFTRPDAHQRSTWRQGIEGNMVLDDVRHLAAYTVEVATFDDPVKTWIGGSWAGDRRVGNMLVHMAKSKGEPLLVSIAKEAEQLLAIGNDIAGNTLLSTSFPSDATITNLLQECKSALHCTSPRCIDENGTEISEDRPLKCFPSLCLQDGTNTYVYIGPEIFSFESGEEIVSFQSGMGHNGDCEPEATTARDHCFLIDGVGDCLGEPTCRCCVSLLCNSSEDEEPEDLNEDVAMRGGGCVVRWASQKKMIHEIIALP